MMKRISVLVLFSLAIGITVIFTLGTEQCTAHSLSVNNKSISMYKSQSEALLFITDYPALADESQLSLSCKSGLPSHNFQLYIRLAYEKDGTIYPSPNAIVYSFSSTKSESSFSLSDILNADENSIYDLIQFELITYRKPTAPEFQYAIFHLPKL